MQVLEWTLNKLKTMKTIRNTLLLFLFTFFAMGSSYAVSDTLIVKSSVNCATCKKTIENGLRFEKGIKLSSVDVAQRTITVIYNPDKTTPEKIKIAITKLGYNADEMMADKKAYDNLEDCCKTGHQH